MRKRDQQDRRAVPKLHGHDAHRVARHPAGAAELRRIAALDAHDDLATEFARLARAGRAAAISLSVSQDAMNATRYAVYLSQSGLGLPDRDYYARDGTNSRRTRGAYVDYIATLLELAGAPRPRTSGEPRDGARDPARAVVGGRVSRTASRNATYNPMTIAEAGAARARLRLERVRGRRGRGRGQRHRAAARLLRRVRHDPRDGDSAMEALTRLPDVQDAGRGGAYLSRRYSQTRWLRLPRPRARGDD